jgi:hypothetical protein
MDTAKEGGKRAVSEAAAEPGGAPEAPEPGRARERQTTVVALFADTIDAEAALRALERGMGSPAQVSLLLRTREVDPADAADRPGAVARSLVAAALETVGAWLLGLASLIVPERGTYLVAGPLGAALRGEETGGAEQTRAVGLVPALAAFGFVEEEAIYLEHRLEADYVLLALTSGDPGETLAARRLFADNDAIHISQGTTESGLAASATSTLSAVLRAAVGTEGEADAPVVFRTLCGQDPVPSACGTAIVDRFGDEAGTIADLLTDAPVGRSDAPIRYLVVAFGGLLGLGRQHVALPVDLADLSVRPVHLAIERKVLHHAPRFTAEAPLSRREELAIRAYFGVEPYWIEGSGDP